METENYEFKSDRNKSITPKTVTIYLDPNKIKSAEALKSKLKSSLKTSISRLGDKDKIIHPNYEMTVNYIKYKNEENVQVPYGKAVVYFEDVRLYHMILDRRSDGTPPVQCAIKIPGVMFELRQASRIKFEDEISIEDSRDEMECLDQKVKENPSIYKKVETNKEIIYQYPKDGYIVSTGYRISPTGTCQSIKTELLVEIMTSNTVQERRDEIRSLVKCNVPDEFLPIYNPDSWAEEKGLDAADVLYQYLLSIGMTNKDDMYPKEIILPVQKPGEFFYDYKKRIRDEVRELKIKSYNESPLRKTSLWKKPNDITSVLEETSDKLIPDDVVDTVLLSSSINSDWSIEQIRNMYGKYCSSQPCKIEMDDCVIRCKAPPLVARTYHGDVLIVFPTAKVCSDTYNLLKTVYVKNPKTSKEERWATTYMAKNYVLRLSMPDRFAPNNKSGKKRYHYPDYSGLIDYKGKHPRGKDPIEQKRNWIVEQRQRVDCANGGKVYGASPEKTRFTKARQIKVQTWTSPEVLKRRR